VSDSSSKDLVYRIVSTTSGDGFVKSAEEAHKAADELDRLLTKAEEADHARVEVKANADTGEAETKLKALESSADGAGRGASGAQGGFGGLATRVSMVTAGAGALAPALAALPAAFAAVGGAGAALSLGLGGIVSALHAYSQVSASPGVSGAQMAATMFSNATAVRNAQQAIAQARQQAAFQSASAVDSLTSAQERLSNAEQSATVAEQDLNRARQDQARTLVQLNMSANTAALDVKAAELAVTEAQRQQIQTNQALTSTALDRQKAELAVEQAQNQLLVVQERAKETNADAAAANAAGVEGSKAVVDAKAREAAAQQGVGDAQRALATTQRQAAQQQITSNDQIAKSVQNLADIQRQQLLAMQASQSSAAGGMSAFNREMAKLTPVGRDVVNTILGMRGGLDQLKATSQNAIGPGVLTFLSGLSSLGPTANGALRDIGQAIGGTFAQFGALMKNPVFAGQLGTIFKEAAALMAAFGQGAVALVGGLASAGANAGPIVSGLADGFKTLMSSGVPAFFAGLTSSAGGAGKSLSTILGTVSDLLGPIGQLLGQIGGALAPVFVALRPVLLEVAKAFAANLLPIIQQLAPIIAQLAPIVGQLVIAFLNAAGPVIKVLLPVLGQLAVTLGNALVPVVKALSPVLLLLANAIAQILPALMPLIPLLANLLVTALQALMPVLAPLIPVIVQLVQTGVRVLSETLTPLIPTIVLLGATLAKLMPQLLPLIVDVVNLSQAFLPLMPVFAQLAAVILNIAIPAIGAILGWLAQLIDKIVGPVTRAVQSVVAVFADVMGKVKKPVEDTLSWLDGKWNGLVNSVSGLGGRLASVGSHIWDWIKDSFKGVINFVIDGWNRLQFTMPSIDTHIPGVGTVGGWSIGVPHIPRLAVGGQIVGDGLAVVGENGPELMPMKTGARVISNPDARAMFGGGSGTPDRFQATLDLKLNGQRLDQVLVEFQRSGGVLQSVQAGALAAFGSVAR
jgi:phage-related protein